MVKARGFPGLRGRWLPRRRAGRSRGAVLAVAAMVPWIGLQAAETVIFNESAAHQCYLAALRGADASEVDVCNDALEHQGLKSADFAATLSNRGLLLARSGRFEDALRDHERAIARAPDLASLYVNRSNTYTRAKRYDEAMKDLDRAIDIAGRPAEPTATVPPVPAASEAVAGPEPVEATQAAPVPVPDPAVVLAAAHYNRALLYQRGGDLGAALADAARARDYAPDREGYREYVLELEALRAGGQPGAGGAPGGSPGSGSPAAPASP